QVDEPSQQLHKECKNCMHLKAKNEDLQEELSTLHAKCEKLEKTKCQLKEEVAKLQHDLETNMEGCRQKEQYKREVEEQANQERRQQQQEVHLFLHAQAASQDRLEQLRSSDHESLRNELQDRIRDLERELARIKNTQQDSPFQQESIQAEVETYKRLYLEEVKLRKCQEKNLEK
ncbi:ANR26 protein, partial [Grallaria varia]|nr:ANR26 protein [Grallaria varia]